MIGTREKFNLCSGVQWDRSFIYNRFQNAGNIIQIEKERKFKPKLQTKIPFGVANIGAYAPTVNFLEGPTKKLKMCYTKVPRDMFKEQNTSFNITSILHHSPEHKRNHWRAQIH